MIKISYETYKRIHLINLSGRFDSLGSQVVNERINSLIDLGHHNLVLNLEKVNYLSSGERERTKVKDLLNKFSELRKEELLDDELISMLQEGYY
ncbi:MAG: hypothetical protein KAW92_14435 [Candidatus Cloacimonetes bacterium]|nr:hypothetical protein [Candidatus Cloacimonadota bacterium]